MQFTHVLGLALLVCSRTDAQQCQPWEAQTNEFFARLRADPGVNQAVAATTLQHHNTSAHATVVVSDMSDSKVGAAKELARRSRRTRIRMTITRTSASVRNISTQTPSSRFRSTRVRSTRPITSRPTAQPSTTRKSTSATVTQDVSSLSYESKYLEAHNVHRRNHSVADLVFDADLARSAAKLAVTCNYHHDTSACQSGCGQNIGAGYTDSQVASFVNNMYNSELPHYPGPYGSDYIDTSSFSSWGHFSQIVWQATAKVGCATRYCASGLTNVGDGVMPYFTVCNYYPPGNVVGQWSNVRRPLGGSTVVFRP